VGDVADDMIDQMFTQEFVSERMYSMPEDYLKYPDSELRAETTLARSKKIKNIRRWSSSLSEKQRWCLAEWASDRDNRINGGRL